MTSIPGGFPQSETVPKAVSLRITRSGLDFIGQHAAPVTASLVDKEKDGGPGDGIFEFRMPSLEIKALGLTVCPPDSPDTACIAQVDLNAAELRIDGVDKRSDTFLRPKAGSTTQFEQRAEDIPNSLRIVGKVPLLMTNLPIKGGPNLYRVAVGKGKCDFGPNKSEPVVEATKIPVEITIPFLAEADGQPRAGLTKLDLDHIKVRTGAQPEDIHGCLQGCYEHPTASDGCEGSTDPLCSCNAENDNISQSLAYLLTDGLEQLLTQQVKVGDTLAKLLCETDCPAGSAAQSPDGGVAGCYPKGATDLSSKNCVMKPLGLQGNVDLGSFISKFAPGNVATFDILAAAGGPLRTDGNTLPDTAKFNQPINTTVGTTKGVTLSTVAGMMEPPDRPGLPKGIPPCVIADFPNPAPKNLDIPLELLQDSDPNWKGGAGGPHAMVAVSEKFLQYAVNNLYKQCVFTLGITTETMPVLNSGLLTLFSASLGKLGEEGKPAALAIVTRPGKPPSITLGGGTHPDNDPLLLLSLKSLSLDIYVWSSDRFVRAFTWNADVDIPLSVQTGVDPQKNPTGGLLPVLGKLRLGNSSVTNSDLLLEDPKVIADRLQKILPGILDEKLGKLPPIDINVQLKALGLSLDLPDKALRKLTKDGENYLGVFAALAVRDDNPPVQTNATLLNKTVDADAMRPEVLDEKRLPVLRTRFEAPGTKSGDVEYSYWIDEGTRSAWSTRPDVDISNNYLFFQGKHELKVVARMRGRTLSEDTTPSVIPFIIDTVAPKIAVKELGRTIELDAWDFVSKEADLVGRYRITTKDGKGSWTEWMPFPKIASIKASQSYGHIEVEVRDEEGNVGTTQQDLVRGIDTDDHGSCACSTPGHDGGHTNAGLLLGGVLGLGLLLARRRRARLSTGLLGVVGTGVAMIPVLPLAGMVGGCSDSVSHNPDKEKADGGGDDNSACSKDGLESLSMGVIGTYTSAAKASDGTIWVAGYNDSAVADGQSIQYGDLVAGKLDKTSGKVSWQSVDGLPSPRTDGSCPRNDPNGWRKGEEDPGDNVGLWTSMQVSDKGTPMVSYFDETNGALKFASYDGSSWKVHTVVKGKEPGGQAGRYSKLLVQDGKPIIAFLTIEAGDKGRTRSKIQIARGKSATPAANGDWTIEDVYADQSGACQPAFCDKSQVCAPQTKDAAGKPVLECIATTASTSCKDCTGSDKACAMVGDKPTCVTKAADDTTVARPNVWGTDLSFAAGADGALGIAALDQINGDLVGIAYDGSKWGAPVVLDGKDKASIDFGVGTSLTLSTRGDWLVTYARGFVESLSYLYLAGGLKAAVTLPAPVIVDFGMRLGDTTFADGKHRVGDDSSVTLGADGALSVVYQDATAGTLRIAQCTKPTDCGKDDKAWTVTAVEQKGKFAGFFPRRLDDQIVNFWRKSDAAQESMSGDVSMVPITAK